MLASGRVEADGSFETGPRRDVRHCWRRRYRRRHRCRRHRWSVRRADGGPRPFGKLRRRTIWMRTVRLFRTDGTHPYRSPNHISIGSGSYARGMTQGDGSTPEDTEWSTSSRREIPMRASAHVDRPRVDPRRARRGRPARGGTPGGAPAARRCRRRPAPPPSRGQARADPDRRRRARRARSRRRAVAPRPRRPDRPQPGHAHPVLDRLEETGDVRRERNRRDRRVVHVHRTAAGGTRVVGARRPDGLLPRPAADSEQVVRAWLLAVLFAAEADE